MTCLFHQDCSDPYHFVLSLITVLGGFVLAFLLVFFIGYIIFCCIHTHDCNSLSHDNYSSILDLKSRVRSLEEKYSELI